MRFCQRARCALAQLQAAAWVPQLATLPPASFATDERIEATLEAMEKTERERGFD